MKLSVILFLITACLFKPLAAEPVRLVSIEGGVNNQILSVVMAEVYRRAGIAVQITPLPSRRAKNMVRDGDADGEVARVANYGKNRDDLIRIDPPINTLLTTAFARTDSDIQISNVSDLEDLTVGAVRGIVHAENAAKHAAKVELVRDIEELMQMLELGRIDVAIHGRMVGELELARAGSLSIRPLAQVLGQRSSHHFLRKKFEEEAAKIEAVLAEMTASGEFEALVDRERNNFVKRYIGTNS